MERKYYLRGLGIGIIVTAVLMGVFLSADKGMTDEEVIARAKKLGMTEAGAVVLSNTDTTEADADDPDSLDVETSQQNTPEEDISDIEKILAEADAAGGDLQNSGDLQGGSDSQNGIDLQSGNETGNSLPGSTAGNRVPDDEESGEDEPDTAAAGTGNPTGEADNSAITTAQIKTISIDSGDSSYSVAKKLADAGIILSAETFDTFLCQNGYDKKIRTGTFSIPADASDEQIARIVTGME